MSMEHPRVAVSHAKEGKKTVHPEVVAEALRELTRQEMREPVDPIFEAAVEKGITTALENIRMRFEQAEKQNDNLEFHNRNHTGDVMRRTRLILEAMGASQRRTRLGELMAAYHDTVQAYTEDKKENGVVMRKRDIGGNETASAQELLDYMNENLDTFTQEERDIITPGIQNTVPDWDPANKQCFRRI